MSEVGGTDEERKAKAREYHARWRRGLSDARRAERLKRKRECAAKRRKENPEKYREYERQYRHDNTEQITATLARHAAKHPGARSIANRRYRLRQYGLTPEGYKDLYDSQGGRCAICGSEIEYIDHDHKTGKVRGLLCHLCNVGLGSFRDSTDYLLNAAQYLEQHNAVA